MFFDVALNLFDLSQVKKNLREAEGSRRIEGPIVLHATSQPLVDELTKGTAFHKMVKQMSHNRSFSTMERKALSRFLAIS